MTPPSTLKEALSDPDVLNDLKDNPSTFRFPKAPHLLIGSESYPPHVFVDNLPDGTWKQRGAMINLLEMMANSINFTYTIKRPVDGAWGQRYDNGTWTGMIGMVARKEVDMALGPFATTLTRSEDTTMTLPVVVDPLIPAVGRQTAEVNPWGFIETFGLYTWITFFLAMVSVTTVLLLISLADRKLFQSEEKDNNFLLQWLSIFYDVYKTIFAQAVGKIQNRKSVQVLIGFWLLFVLVMLKTFDGTLVSLLAVRDTPVIFKNLKDILKHESIAVVIEAKSAISESMRIVKTGSFGEFGKLYEKNRIIEEFTREFYDTMLDNVNGKKDQILITEKLLQGTLISQNFKETGQCNFYTISESIMIFRMGMSLQKNSPLITVINDRILRYEAMGFYSAWVSESVANATSCYAPPGKVSKTEAYTISSLWAVFAVTGCGLALSMLIFFLELLFPRMESLRGRRWKGFNVLTDLQKNQ